MAGSTWEWIGGTGQATIAANWTLVAGQGNSLGVPQAGDTAINTGGTIYATDLNLVDNLVEDGGTVETAAFIVAGDFATSFQDPTLDSRTVITSDVPGNTTPEASLLAAVGNFVNEGTILADGPPGSSFTIDISGTTIAGTFYPGYAYNAGLIQADAGNTLIIDIGASSELFNAGTIVADGGTVQILAGTSAIAGGYAPVKGVAVIEGGGTLETNAAYDSSVSGVHSFFLFGDETPGNTLKIDNLGSFGGWISGFSAGDTIDLGTSLAIGTLVYVGDTSFLYLENDTGTVLASLSMDGPWVSGTFAVSDGTADGLIIGTGSDGDTVLTTSIVDPVTSGTSGTWQSPGSWVDGTVPSAGADPQIGEGASAAFTLTTGSSPVSVAGFAITSALATLQITSDTTAVSQMMNDFAGTLDVAAGNTLSGSALEAVGPSTAVTIAAGATIALTGRLNPELAPVAGDWTDRTGDDFAAVFAAGTAEIDGALLAGPPAGGGGGSVSISDDGDESASVTVNSGGTVTDTYSFLGSDPTSSGTLTLDGTGASWTDEIDVSDTAHSTGYILVGYNDTSSNTPAGLTPPGPADTAQLLIENGATLTDQMAGYIGDTIDSAGNVTVETGGLWNLAVNGVGFLDVGDAGTGALTVDGGTVEVGNVGTFFNNSTSFTGNGIAVGYSVGSSGTVTVGSGGLLTDAGGIDVGRNGQGTLDVLNGGTVDFTTAHGLGVGVSAGAAGMVIVSGTTSMVTLGTANTGIGVGEAGQGLLEVENGATIENYSSGHGIGIGETAGAAGTIVVSGTASMLSQGTTTGGIGVGEAGQGLLEVENGGTVSSLSTDGIGVGQDVGGAGTLGVSGLGALLIDAGDIGVGEAGQGLLEVENGGTADVTASGFSFVAGYDADGSGTVVVDGSGSLLEDVGQVWVGYAASGTLTVSNSGEVETTGTGATGSSGIFLGGVAGASGIMTVTSAGTVSSLGSGGGVGVGLGGSGSLDISSGGVVNVGTNFVGIGYNGAIGVVSVENGGTLIDANIEVGYTGTGTLDIASDGTANTTGGVISIGTSLGATGTVVVSGAGALIASAAPIRVGEVGQGFLDVTNGGSILIDNASVGDLDLGGSGSGAEGGTGTVVVSGGGNIDAYAGLYVWSGSTLEVEAGSGAELGTDAAYISGTVLVSGIAASLTALGTSGGIGVGVSGSGSLDISADGLVNAGSNFVAIGYSGATGIISVENSGTLIGGYLDVGSAGAGSLIVSDSGLVETTATGVGSSIVDIGQDSGSSGTLIVESSGTLLTPGTYGVIGIGDGGSGSLDVNSNGLVDAGANFVVVGESATGIVSVENGGKLLALGTDGLGIAVGDGGSGTLDVDSDGLVDAGTNSVSIGDDGGTGVVSVENGGTLIGYILVGAGGSGSLDVDSDGLVNAGTNSVSIGDPGSTGVVSVENGGTLLGDGIDVGSGLVGFFGDADLAGTGSLAVTSGGTVATTGGLIVAGGQIGGGIGTTGTVVVSGPGSVITVGGEFADIEVGLVGQGVLEVLNSGSVLNSSTSFGNLDVGGDASGPGGGTGTVVVSGGGHIEADGNLYIWAGSSLSVDASSGIDVGGSGTYVAGAVDIENGQDLVGDGLVEAAVVNDGSIVAASAGYESGSSGGTLEISGSIIGSGSIELWPSATAMLDNSIAASQLIYFGNGGSQNLVLGAPGTTFGNAIFNLYDGDRIELAGISITAAGVTSPGTVTVTEADNSTYQLTDVNFTAGSSQQFSVGRDSATGDDFIQVLCFCTGTTIRTPGGEVPVDHLATGDLVLTRTGKTRPIVWIGVGRVLATRGRRTAATPVIVRKSAFADNVPHHDLRVTKGHAFYLDGVLIPVEFLVNHRTILWDDRAQEVALYHIELASHDVLIANGAPAESYRDDGNRWLFRNANTGWGLPPQDPCAPVLTGGPIVDAVWRRLLDRAGSRSSPSLTGDPDLHLMVDGKRVDAMERHDGMYAFRLREHPCGVRLCSRAAVPQELGTARDDRELGVAVRGIVLAQAKQKRAIEADAASLTDGYHAFELDNGIRWTNGDAAVPADLFADVTGPCMLIVHLGGTTQYRDDGKAVRVA